MSKYDYGHGCACGMSAECDCSQALPGKRVEPAAKPAEPGAKPASRPPDVR